MKQYTHGGDIYTAQDELKCTILDFSANINPLGLQDCVKDAIRKNLDACEHYPDPYNRKLRDAIASYDAVDPEQVLCGNGSADLIFRLAFSLKPKKAMVLAPTFAEYESALKSADEGTEIMCYFLKPEEEFVLTDAIIDELDDSFDMLFICNPNNPTGQLADYSLMHRIAQACLRYGITLVVDECFLDFLENPETYSLKPDLKKNPNLIILKAFTKVFAMPGIRLGYLLTDNETYRERISSVGQPWSVSVLAECAGVAALSEQGYVERARRLVRDERSYLIKQLKKFNIEPIGSHANYLFFKLNKKIALKDLLYPKGILIRSCANYRGLDEQYYRIAVKKHHENEILIDALKMIFD